jgi:muramoyltetrapeptide carboxypeptidase LdcA involved in peptidoglycan recycling
MGADWIKENPEARANDLMDAFRDPTIKAIICNIGGDDSIRLLPYIDYDIIRENPKIFMGFSDSTVTHFMCLKAGLASIYGPSVLTAFSENVAMHEYTVRGIKKTLFHAVDPIGIIPENNDGWTAEILDWTMSDNQYTRRHLQPSYPWRYIGQVEKTVQGILIGGCLEVLQWLPGTDIWPPIETWKNAILFLETSEKDSSPLYLKRFLRCLASQNILHCVVGILFGKPGGYETSELFEEYEKSFLDIYQEYNLPLVPIVCGMSFGHTDPFWPLPFGCVAEINPVAKTLTILEAAVLEPDCYSNTGSSSC